MIDLWMRKAKPPPVSFPLSFLIIVKFGKSLIFDLSFSFVSCNAAILMLLLFIHSVSSVCLFFIPLQLNCKIFISVFFFVATSGWTGGGEGGGGFGGGGREVGWGRLGDLHS